jgi:hypothetical protein
MTDEKKDIIDIPDKLLYEKPESAFAALTTGVSTNVWKDAKTYSLKVVDKVAWDDQVVLCRFFYKTEPLVSTVINKLVEVGINDIIISKSGLSDNEFRVFKALKPRLLEFSEAIAQELLLSGLAVPEVGYGPMEKDEIFALGIKKYNKLIFPNSMWVRDPKSIKINASIMSDTPSYSVIIPDEVIQFINSKGKYSDGVEDKNLYDELKTYYPDFVKRVLGGEKQFLLDNELIIRRKYLSDNPYPIPYIASSLDALQHKRRMRRMDYSIMDKVISAIMHVKVGSDQYPVTSSEEDKTVFSDLRSQLMLRFQSDMNLERIFQLITNHTVDISWVFPETKLLSDVHRYDDINEEILFGMGFPRVLITGETSKSGTSNADIAILSPIRTMEVLRRKIIDVLSDICTQVAEQNNFKVPDIKFKALNLHSFIDFMTGLEKLYNISGVSRGSVSEYLGYDFEEESDKLANEETIITAKGLSPSGKQPFSANPSTTNNNQNQNNQNQNNQNQDNNNPQVTKQATKPPVPAPKGK